MASAELQIFITADGSPTLITKTDSNYEEKMHHSGGAWSETLYIYLPALQFAAEGGNLSILSLGLGLAYNEILAVALHLKSHSSSPCHIVSFESSPLLRDCFQKFIREEDTLLSPHYDQILHRTSEYFSISPKSLREHLQNLLNNNSLELRGSYPQHLLPNDSFSCILYDAFSNKMNPELWEESFLKEKIGILAQKDCVLSTYAATGTIKRAMKALDFKKVERPGFAGKRDSSFYVRSSRIPFSYEEK